MNPYHRSRTVSSRPRVRPLAVFASALALLFAGSPPTLSAQTPDVEARVARHADEAIALRHRIHANPELSNRDTETAALVAEHLRALGFDEVRTGVAHTGVVGILRGGR